MSVIAAKGSICSHCGVVAAYPFLQPLRYVPGRMPWNYAIDDIQISCSDCHYKGRKSVTEFLQLLREFSVEDQMLLVDVTQSVLDNDPNDREIIAQRLRVQSRDFLAVIGATNYYLEEKVAQMNAAFLRCDPLAVNSLIDFLDLTSRIPSGERFAFLKDLRQKVQATEGEEKPDEEVDNFKLYGQE